MILDVLIKSKPSRCLVALGLVSLAVVGPVSAQPDTNNAGKADNPNNIQIGRGGNGPGGGGFQNMTPEQRKQMQEQMEQRMAQMREQNVRTMLIRAGFTDTALQDAVVAFVQDQDKAANSLREQATKLRELLGNQAATDAQTATLLNDLHAAADTEKDRRTKAEAALDTKIGYTKKPKLEAILTIMGIVGDEAGLTSTGSVLGGGMGGRGGMAGGGFGGMGGGGGFGGGGMNANGGGFGGRRNGGGRNGANANGGGNAGGNNAGADAPPPPPAGDNNRLAF
jgi:hypothetical protein